MIVKNGKVFEKEGTYGREGYIYQEYRPVPEFDGNFTTIKPEWKDVRVGMEKCLAIISNEGEDIKDILSLEEIEEAVRFTIFELSEDDDE